MGVKSGDLLYDMIWWIMENPAVLIYDGRCAVCQKTVKWLKEQAQDGTFEFLQCQSETVKKRFPDIKEDVCLQAMQLVLPDNRVLSGEEALSEIFSRLRKYYWAARFFNLPGANILARAFYRWFAGKRYLIAALLWHTPCQGGR